MPDIAHVPGLTPRPDGRHPDFAFDAPDEQFLFGVDLFNFGYYWEAHEVWEGLWKRYDRQHPVARALQALIKLAAAGVKAGEHRPNGVRRHLIRVVELLNSVLAGPATDTSLARSLCNLPLATVVANIEEFLNTLEPPDAPRASPRAVPSIVFPFLLLPQPAFDPLGLTDSYRNLQDG